jgi:hypothetical protein
MGLFGRSKKKSNSEKEEGNKEKVTKKHEDYISELGLIEYKDGHLSEIVESKDIMEVYNRFGIYGMIRHSIMCAHFKSMDIVSQYFKEEDKRTDWKGDPILLPYYKLSDLPNLMSDRKLSKSTDVTVNLDSFVQNLIISESNIQRYNEEYTYNEINKYLLDLQDNSELIKISKEIIGFNFLYLLSPFCYVYLWAGDIEGKEVKIIGAGYNTILGNSNRYNRNRRNFSRDDISNLGRWFGKYEHSYIKSNLKFLDNFVNLKMESLNTDKQIFNLKKRSFELLKNDKEKSKHFSKIFSHIHNVKDLIFSQTQIFNEIDSIEIVGWDGIPIEIDLIMGFFSSKFFELETIINICGLMIEAIDEKDEFSYSELYTLIEPYKVFDKTIEKEMLKNVKNILDELKKINNNLVKINESIISGFNSVVSQLEGVNNKLYFNNLLGVINTYQLYRISKK